MSYFSTTIFNMSKDGPRDTEIPKIKKKKNFNHSQFINHK